MEKTIITYQMYDHMMDNLVEQIEFSKLYTKVKYVYGPPRGGLPIAVHLAHHLGLDYADSEWFHNMMNREQREKTLIVDDVADTGQTLKRLKLIYSIDFITATLHYKTRSTIKPDFFVEETNSWVCYPWERLDETPNREGYNDKHSS